ncbi:MAG: hypothetical protein WDO16_02140 [Bacteroidota bacterium]
MKKIVIFYLVSLLGCNQSPCKIKIGNLETSTNFSDSFFKDTVFITKPTSIEVYKNDSLESFEKFNQDTLESPEISNAFIFDQNNISFGFSKCEGTLNSDTLIINFISVFNESLLIKVFKKKYIVEYSDHTSKKDSTWQVCSQYLTLSPNYMADQEKVLGKIKVTLSMDKKCSDDSMIVLEGPFYFKKL